MGFIKSCREPLCFTNLLIVKTMAALSSIDAVKNRQRNTVTTLEVSPPSLPRCRATSSLKRNLYDIEIVDEDEESDRVRIHYVGYSSEYDEWRNRSEIVVRPPQTVIPPRVDPVNFSFSNLLCAIKKQLKPSREDPTIRIQLPFEEEDCEFLIQKGTKCKNSNQFKMNSYSELDGVLGEDWHYRVVNTRGDFSFIVLETVRFHVYRPKPILEYVPKLKDSKLQYIPAYTHQQTQLVFSFVRREGNSCKLVDFLSK